jgi:mannose-6-phosphate isomerase-like protein (cupin superfamily)
MFKKGNVFEESDRNGWIYGNFMPLNDLAKDDRAEIKVAKLDNSFTSKPHYNKTSTKLDIIWEGRAIWEVDEAEVEMNKGDYLIIPPKTVVCIKKVLSEILIVQTIRIPSTPDDKVMA